MPTSSPSGGPSRAGGSCRGEGSLKVHLLDGTYELFRHHYGAKAGARAAAAEAQPTDDQPGEPADEVAATRGVLWSVLGLLEGGVTHIGVATDHVIESFRNDMWPGYKSSAGMPEDLLAQFPLLEDALRALGVVVWPMVDLEADDALAAAAATAAADAAVNQVVVMTPDKDLAQCVTGMRIVQLDRRTGKVFDEAGVRDRYGVAPESIPDWLALVGDSSDGFPGLAGFGKTTASALLARYPHLEDIPADGGAWAVDVRSPTRLSATLAENMGLALLFRDLATLRSDAAMLDGVETLRWSAPTLDLAEIAVRLRAPRLVERAIAVARGRAAAAG